MGACACAEGHLLAPLNVALVESLLEEELVVIDEHLVHVEHLVLVFTAEVFVAHSLQLSPLQSRIKHLYNHAFHIREEAVCTAFLLLYSRRPFERLKL